MKYIERAPKKMHPLLNRHRPSAIRNIFETAVSYGPPSL